MAKIGFVGLGHMGLPMAINLVKAGHKVTGYDIKQTAIDQLLSKGGLAAKTVHDAAKEQDVIITMLQTGQQVLHVCLGIDGLFSGAKDNALFIDCSTIDVKTSREISATATENNLLTIDAPVSGGVGGATAGTLTFMVGGSEQAYTKALPILNTMGQKVIYTGNAGSGQAAKICNNMILGISMIAVSEAFTLAEELGLSPHKLYEVVNNSSGQCWTVSKYIPVPGILENVPANNDYKAGFAAKMMLKDLILSQESANSVQLSTPLGAKTTELYQHLIDQGLGDTDFSAIIKYIAQGKEI